MPVDWDKFDREIDEAVANAAQKTNEELAGKASSITRMTDEEIKELFPKPADVKKLKDLMRIVKDSTDMNTKITNITNNAEKFAGIIVTLLGKLA